MSARSTNNFTLEPLDANRIYIGKYDSVLQYASAIVSVNGDTDMELIAYTSVDKIRTTSTAYPILASTPYTKIIQLSAPYIYFTLRNSTGVAQTYLNFDVIYREVSVPEASAVASNVSIFDSAGNSLLSDGSNALQTYITNASIPVTYTPSGTQDVSIVADDVGLALDTSVQAVDTTLKFKDKSKLWDNELVAIAGVSAVASSLTYPSKFLSVFGTVSSATTLTLQLSFDGVTYYDTQYSYDATGDFGFALQLPFYYLRFKSSASATITLAVSYC